MTDETAAPERVVIKPTIGRIVWYYPNEHDPLAFSNQPLAAMVSYVHSDDVVNLGVLCKNGTHHGRLNVRLLQEGDKVEDLPLSFGVRPNYCEWMPFQKGQAARHKPGPDDGPTIAEWVAAGYKASNYPPSGYKPKSTQAEIDAAIEAELAAEEAAKKKGGK